MNQKWTRTTYNPEETDGFARSLGTLLKANDVLTLEGDLGTGKTTFTKGLARAIGVTKTVNSPTFTIMKEYKGRLALYHMDAYRIEDDMEDLGLDEYFEGDGVTVVEWPKVIGDQLPGERLDIHIEYGKELDSRVFRFHAHGQRYEKLCEELFQL
ncbi:tRNA (adenosine(37)-N6)-threonylcarbamoyltransferase complex ATPase subunit type 1 TsaE [Salipaludibacillus neizhouensis]|uniref:tRNA threonylcarbamoyladenosine biosynthesis protein TsaE n=1 Tax=Salipaludibacillus neizhouensis TaxID=885475 RepID=A0A3A9K5G9_9BACI|nr:tRNA (adenosine(37)-N6)-threonylcarbamoyltransferase complex ATPase subunit type 1 TsaE [Salipaludibacillus neizhouensis]RKL64923.1 tRNA (adenosine(37)-N6)-threonylcarbamoyltransferase complex ATPase subunit type 1 TsaE [Salipaludibacillus neizhouensis]